MAERPSRSPRDTPAPPRRRRSVALAALLAVVAALVAVGRVVDVQALLDATRAFVDGLGYWGPAGFVAIYVGAVLAGLPGTPLTVLAALVFGPRQGFVVMVVASSLAAAAGFLLARHALRRPLEARLGALPAAARIKTLVEGNAWFVVPVLHLMPVMPFSLTNYGLGLTRVRFWRFLLWSEVVMVPMNAVWVFGAHALWRAAVAGEPAWGLLGATAAAALLLLGLGVVVRRAGRRREQAGDAGGETAGGGPGAHPPRAAA